MIESRGERFGRNKRNRQFSSRLSVCRRDGGAVFDKPEIKYDWSIADSSAEKYETADRVEQGKESPYETDGTLRSSVKYELNGFRYETDEYGRLIRIYGDVHMENAEMENAEQEQNAQKRVGKLGGETGYDGGHVIASQFSNDGWIANLFP